MTLLVLQYAFSMYYLLLITYCLLADIPSISCCCYYYFYMNCKIVKL